MLDDLKDENFILYAAKYYDNSCKYDTDEFYDDLKRFQYLKRLFVKCKETGEVRERLILNHIIILYNLFGDKATNMLFLKLEGMHEYLKPFIVFLGYMKNEVKYNGKTIYASDIELNSNIVEILRKI